MTPHDDSLGAHEQRTSPWAVLGWTAFAGLAVYAIFIGGGHAGTRSPTFGLVSLGLIMAGLLVWAALALTRPQWRPRSAKVMFLMVLHGCVLSHDRPVERATSADSS